MQSMKILDTISQWLGNRTNETFMNSVQYCEIFYLKFHVVIVLKVKLRRLDIKSQTLRKSNTYKKL